VLEELSTPLKNKRRKTMRKDTTNEEKLLKMKYTTKPKTIEAIQWFKNGDHPNDNCETFTGSDGLPFQGEGKVVRYYRHPSIDGNDICLKCNSTMHEHGWIDNGEDDNNVCPGDFIVTTETGYIYPEKPKDFNRKYVKDLTLVSLDHTTQLIEQLGEYRDSFEFTGNGLVKLKHDLNIIKMEIAYWKREALGDFAESKDIVRLLLHQSKWIGKACALMKSLVADFDSQEHSYVGSGSNFHNNLQKLLNEKEIENG